MLPSKNWMQIVDRRENEYNLGVKSFLDFAFQNAADRGKICCPCNNCKNADFRDREEVEYHLLKYGILKDYTTWKFHGEKLPFNETQINDENSEMPPFDDMVGLIHDVCGIPNVEGNVNEDTSSETFVNEDPCVESATFYRLLQEGKQKLYPSCEHSKLGVIVKLLHLKSFHRWTNSSFDALLAFLQEIIPNGKQAIPNSFYSAHKYISDLGLDYIKYDVCENNCIVYYDANASAQACPICGLSRWKVANRTDGGKKVPHKVLRYFPIKSRLQRLFTSDKTASDLRWHKDKRVDDGIMRHPADTTAWKTFDSQHPNFAVDARNVRLALATDGFQPFGNMSSQHSLWPVVLTPLNFPPWKCMKQPYFMMSLLIPGPYSPGMGIDVFLEPLINELKELWENGVETYDAHAKRNFKLRAAILWTINDFPAYGDLAGWSTKGYLGCPSCHKDTSSFFLYGSRKICYMGHRRFLPKSHKWRKQSMAFDGTIESRLQPQPLSSEEVLNEINSFEQQPFGRGLKRKYDNTNSFKNWRKKSVFFQLPYWKTLLIRHNLDVMHIEKNVCDNIIGTIMNMKDKTKDTLGSRYDLVRMGIRPELHPRLEGNKVKFTPGRYTLSKDDKTKICKMLKQLKTPDGFLSNISRCVNVEEQKISGMKSHDCHVMIEKLLPIIVRGFLPDDVCEPLIELSAFFRDLCQKSLSNDDLDRLQRSVILTLCKLEMKFPPSFFDIMVHLVVHLVDEAKKAGTVQYRWMYPIERYLRTLKGYVRNKARPEGSIAEAYIVDECLTFCSRYLDGIDTKFNRPTRYTDIRASTAKEGGLEIFEEVGSTSGKPICRYLTDELKLKAQLYVLNNCPEVLPFIEEYKRTLPSLTRAQFLRRYNMHFTEWFKNHVVRLHESGSVSDDIFYLALGPNLIYKTFHEFDVNGFRFHTLSRDESRKTQSSGVLCRGDTDTDDKEYYGVLEEVWEMQYANSKVLHLFKCHWYDVRNCGVGYRIDKYGITTVNTNKCLNTNEPFVLACQAEQVFYIPDPINPRWAVVMKAQPRDLYSMPCVTTTQSEEEVSLDVYEVYQEEEHDAYGRITRPLDEGDDVESLHRNDVEDEEQPIEDARVIENRIAQSISVDNDFVNVTNDEVHENEYDSAGSQCADLDSDDD